MFTVLSVSSIGQNSQHRWPARARLLALSIAAFAALSHAVDTKAAGRSPEANDVGFPPRVYGEFKPSPLLEKQRKQLYLFVMQIFQRPLPGLEHGSNWVKRRDIMRRFGTAHRISEREFLTRDPYDPPYVETAFEFDGIRIIAHSPRIADGTKADLLQVSKVDVTSSVIQLKYGIRVGQPLMRFVQLFGEVEEGHLTPEKATYSDVAYYACGERKDITCVVAYELELVLDQEQRVRKVALWIGGDL